MQHAAAFGMAARFRNRREAGERLAHYLLRFADRPDVIVLGLPRGGVPVAFEVARALHARLDVFVVRKLGVPWHPELAMGAIAAGGVRVLDRDLILLAQVSDADVERVTKAERDELERRELRYRGARPFPSVAGQTVILVDDGLATGSTMRAAITALRIGKPARIVVAVPVAARETCAIVRDVADEIVCAETPEQFGAVGIWYNDFSQTTDEEVFDLLDRARNEEREHSASGPRAG
jgi:putative phosphoribosyl transferase